MFDIYMLVPFMPAACILISGLHDVYIIDRDINKFAQGFVDLSKITIGISSIIYGAKQIDLAIEKRSIIKFLFGASLCVYAFQSLVTQAELINS
jgi:hypothetical protein